MVDMKNKLRLYSIPAISGASFAQAMRMEPAATMAFRTLWLIRTAYRQHPDAVKEKHQRQEGQQRGHIPGRSDVAGGGGNGDEDGVEEGDPHSHVGGKAHGG